MYKYILQNKVPLELNIPRRTFLTSILNDQLRDYPFWGSLWPVAPAVAMLLLIFYTHILRQIDMRIENCSKQCVLL